MKQIFFWKGFAALATAAILVNGSAFAECPCKAKANKKVNNTNAANAKKVNNNAPKGANAKKANNTAPKGPNAKK